MGFKLDQASAAGHVATESKGSIEKLLKTEIVLFGESFGSKKKHAFYQELSVLLNAGIPMRSVLELIVKSQPKQKDQQLLGGILDHIVKGMPFSEALQKAGKFSDYEVFSLRIGEETGTTAKVCEELALFYMRKKEQRDVVVAALTYPAIVMSTSLLVVIFMLTYVVPMFQDIFRQNKIELPMLTRMIIGASGFLKTSWLYLVLVFVAIGIAVKTLGKRRAVKSVWHYALLRIPVIGNFVKKIYLAQFTQAIALLTSAKVPMLNSMRMVGEMIMFIPLQDAIKVVESRILEGKSLSEGMKGNVLFDERIISMVKVSEETNETEYVFRQINDQYSQEVSRQSKTLSVVIEPFMILIVGIVVGILLVAMYLPMFQLSSAIG